MKLHYLDAEMDEIAVPGILAYKAGDCFANLVSIVNEIPSGKDFSASTLEEMLQQYVKSTLLQGTVDGMLTTLRLDIRFSCKVLSTFLILA